MRGDDLAERLTYDICLGLNPAAGGVCQIVVVIMCNAHYKKLFKICHSKTDELKSTNLS
jgi:hypothetical protein